MRKTVGCLLLLGLAVVVRYGIAQESSSPSPFSPPGQVLPLPPKGVVVPGPLPQDLWEISPEEQSNIRVYQSANRSVVNITTHSVQADDLLLFNNQREGSGSGSILDGQGHILTNYHVIEEARQIAVTLYDGSTHEAKLIGSDPNNDLAVLKIEVPASKLNPLPWGDSNYLQVGMRVFAIGNPFGLERTLTIGIVSSLNRSLRSENNRMIRGIIQTDAAINPGNSGGPLLNRRGEMVGITTAIVSRAGQSSGIGLAIPSAPARRVAEELIRFGHVIRPDCGIFSVMELEKGILIGRLVPNGPAQRAGLRGPQLSVIQRGGIEYSFLDRSKADMVIAVDGHRIKTLDDLLSYVETRKPGERVTFSLLREGQKVDVPVELSQAKN